MASMSARSLKFCFLVLLLSSILCPSQARPFDVLKATADGHGTISGRIVGILDGLSLGSMKSSGPSPGAGHKFTNSQTLGGIKDSGPSPGAGHNVVTGTHH
ncbi:hypothetical protein NMG60_11026008 [Bertholletia excelsa]